MGSTIHSLRPGLLAFVIGATLLLRFAHAGGPGVDFRRGDVDESSDFDLTDGVRIFGYLFLGSPERLACEDAADTDDNSSLEVTDGVYLLNYLFLGGPPPPMPFAECGADATADRLGCERYEPCGGPEICGGFAGFVCEGDVEDVFCEHPPGTCDVVDNAGECTQRPVACPEIFDPVCGCDGVTYGNDCERQAAGVSKDHDGPCAEPCGGFAGAVCDGDIEDVFCEHPPGTCDVADNIGECTQRPRACPRIFDPVCGCDGVTYGNDCERQAAGVSKDHDGPCATICDGFAGLVCEGDIEDVFCEHPPGTCDIVDNAGECTRRPEACPAIFDPVCGCDGRTYGNDCERQAAGVSKNHDGPCEER